MIHLFLTLPVTVGQITCTHTSLHAPCRFLPVLLTLRRHARVFPDDQVLRTGVAGCRQGWQGDAPAPGHRHLGSLYVRATHLFFSWLHAHCLAGATVWRRYQSRPRWLPLVGRRWTHRSHSTLSDACHACLKRHVCVHLLYLIVCGACACA